MKTRELIEMPREIPQDRVGSRLREIRNAHGMTQETLAAKLGRDVETVRQIEQGERSISATELWDLCALFDMKPYEFFQGRD